MPSVRYMNESAPFWDFVANLEQQGQNHPFFGGPSNNEERGHGPDGDNVPFGAFGPWGWGHPGMPFHGRGHHHGPPPPPPHHEDAENMNEKDVEMEKEDHGEGPSNTEPDNTPEGFGPRGSWGRHGGRCGGRRGGRHGWGAHGFGSHERRGPHGRGGFGRSRGGWGGPFVGRGGPFGGFGGPWGLAGLANMFNPEAENSGEDKDFEPEADIFDTQSSYIIHLSLPGAKKEDVGVNWDHEKSELSIAGVIYRPGDEELLKTLSMDERKVGPFERKIRLGTRANPAQIDADGITAKLEDGILRVEVPKEEAGFVEVRKVDIE